MSNVLNTIMLVDDEEITNIVHHAIIAKMQVCDDVRTYLSAREALRDLINLYEKEQLIPDYLFLDLNMPGMTGWEFLNELGNGYTEIAVRTKIYVVSSTQNPDEIQQAADHPYVNGFIGKPLSEGKLSAILGK